MHAHSEYIQLTYYLLSSDTLVKCFALHYSDKSILISFGRGKCFLLRFNTWAIRFYSCAILWNRRSQIARFNDCFPFHSIWCCLSLNQNSNSWLGDKELKNKYYVSWIRSPYVQSSYDTLFHWKKLIHFRRKLCHGTSFSNAWPLFQWVYWGHCQKKRKKNNPNRAWTLNLIFE